MNRSAKGRRSNDPDLANATARVPDLTTISAWAIAALGLFLAWRRRFVQDDAFISFQYARALVEGQGLTWFGERVEGYTNFLWVLWIALGLRFGVDPIVWSWVGGLAAYAVVLHATWRLGSSLCGSPFPALVALFCLATNASVAAFATGGLETMLQAAFLTSAVLHLALFHRALEVDSESPRPRATRQALALSLCLAAAVLTRLDSALLALVVGGDALLSIARARGRRDMRLSNVLVSLVVPFAVLVGGWMVWKLVYYGDALPNTFHAKVRWDPATWTAGALYVWRFLDAYVLWLFLAVAGVAWATRRVPIPPERKHAWAVVAITTVAWLVYLMGVGGDFMEFRMIVPVLPFVFLLIAFPACTVLPRFGALAGMAMALVLAAASAQHWRTFDGVTADRRLDSVPALANFYSVYPDGDWARLGRELREQLAGTNAVLALHAIGAIPYYSQLRSVDMYGLTDREVARTGNLAPSTYQRPGHQRQITQAQMRQRGVNLVIGHPTILGRGLVADPRYESRNAQWVSNVLSLDPLPTQPVKLVAMPLQNPPSVLLMWYLTPTPEIDAVIARRGWETTTVTVR